MQQEQVTSNQIKHSLNISNLSNNDSVRPYPVPGSALDTRDLPVCKTGKIPAFTELAQQWV